MSTNTSQNPSTLLATMHHVTSEIPREVFEFFPDLCIAACTRDDADCIHVQPPAAAKFADAILPFAWTAAIQLHVPAIHLLLNNSAHDHDFIILEAGSLIPIVDDASQLQSSGIISSVAIVRDKASIVLWSMSWLAMMTEYFQLEHQIRHHVEDCACSEIAPHINTAHSLFNAPTPPLSAFQPNPSSLLDFEGQQGSLAARSPFLGTLHPLQQLQDLSEDGGYLWEEWTTYGLTGSDSFPPSTSGKDAMPEHAYYPWGLMHGMEHTELTSPFLSSASSSSSPSSSTGYTPQTVSLADITSPPCELNPEEDCSTSDFGIASDDDDDDDDDDISVSHLLPPHLSEGTTTYASRHSSRPSSLHRAQQIKSLQLPTSQAPVVSESSFVSKRKSRHAQGTSTTGSTTCDTTRPTTRSSLSLTTPAARAVLPQSTDGPLRQRTRSSSPPISTRDLSHTRATAMLSLPSSSRVSSTTNCASIDTEDIEMSDDGSEPDDGSKVSDYEDDSDYDDDDDDDDDDYAAGSSTRKRARAKAIQPRRQVNRKQRRTSVDAQRDEDTLGGAGDLGDEDAEGDDEEDDAGPPRKRAKPSVRSPDPAPVKKQPPRKRKKASNTTKKSRFSCPLCGTTVGRESDLGRHQRESCRKGAKPPSGYVCPHEGCGNVLSRADALKRHVESVHGAEA